MQDFLLLNKNRLLINNKNISKKIMSKAHQCHLKFAFILLLFLLRENKFVLFNENYDNILAGDPPHKPR